MTPLEKKLGLAFMAVRARHRVSGNAESEYWRLLQEYAPALAAQERPLRHLKTVRSKLNRDLPAVYMDAVFVREMDGERELKKVCKVASLKTRKLAKEGWQRASSTAYTSLTALKKLAAYEHQDNMPTEYDMSIDGVEESKSGNKSIIYVTVRKMKRLGYNFN